MTKQERHDATLGRDRTYRWANLIVGFQIPRAWLRRLSVRKYVQVIKYVRFVWEKANDNNPRTVKRPRWFPPHYLWGKKCG